MTLQASPPPEIRQRIREDILSGDIPLGSRLTIEELAARYGVSHMPVREALRQLHGEGLVLMERHRGARVRPIDLGFVENMFDIRGALESLMAKRAAQRCATADLDPIAAIEDRLEACIAREAYPEILAENRAFHSAINAIADNPDAEALLDRHWILIAALWRRYGYGPERFAGVASDHRALLRALGNRDADAAAALMAAHVIKAKQELLARMAEPAAPEKGRLSE